MNGTVLLPVKNNMKIPGLILTLATAGLLILAGCATGIRFTPL